MPRQDHCTERMLNDTTCAGSIGHWKPARNDFDFLIIFYCVIYTSNWPASRRARPSTNYMLPSMIFDDFEWILHPWREQSNSGNNKNQRVLMHVRTSTDHVRFEPLQLRHSYFLWWFYGKISMILSDFCIHGVRKATPVTTKANAFWCNFAGRSTACVFEHCATGIHVFSCSFRGDLCCILD